MINYDFIECEQFFQKNFLGLPCFRFSIIVLYIKNYSFSFSLAPLLLLTYCYMYAIVSCVIEVGVRLNVLKFGLYATSNNKIAHSYVWLFVYSYKCEHDTTDTYSDTNDDSLILTMLTSYSLIVLSFPNNIIDRHSFIFKWTFNVLREQQSILMLGEKKKCIYRFLILFLQAPINERIKNDTENLHNAFRCFCCCAAAMKVKITNSMPARISSSFLNFWNDLFFFSLFNDSIEKKIVH